jgi:hypothetical protein
VSTEAERKHAVANALAAVAPQARIVRIRSIGTRFASGHAVPGDERGVPDLLVLLPGGRSAWLESRPARNGLTKAQRDWHASARKLGHTVGVAWDAHSAVAAVRRALAACEEAP